MNPHALTNLKNLNFAQMRHAYEFMENDEHYGDKLVFQQNVAHYSLPVTY